MMMLSGLFEGVVRELEEVVVEVRRLEAYRMRVLEELSRLNPLDCTLDYRWVKNAQGHKYCCYYYCIRYKDGKRETRYIGKSLNFGEDVIRDKLRYRELSRVLRQIDKQLSELWKVLNGLRRDVSRARALAGVPRSVFLEVEEVRV